ELPSPQAGVLKRVLKKPGDTVPVGGVLAELDETAAKAGNGASAVAASKPVTAQASASANAPAGPAARVTAAVAGIEVQSVPGTGPGGRVLKEDVQRVASEKAVATPVAKAPAPPPPKPVVRTPGTRTE